MYIVVGLAIAAIVLCVGQASLQSYFRKQRMFELFCRVTPLGKFCEHVTRALLKQYGCVDCLPCGILAEAVETRVHFEACKVTDIMLQGLWTRQLYRLHFEIDADNVSNDHVIFMVPFQDFVVVFHSYVDEFPPQLSRKSWKWFQGLMHMVHTNNAAQWNRNFGVHHPAFQHPCSVSCHVSVGCIN